MNKKLTFIKNQIAEILTSGRTNSLKVVNDAMCMPSFAVFSSHLLQRSLNGEQFPVDVEELYINSEDWERDYNLLIIEVVENFISKKKWN